MAVRRNHVGRIRRAAIWRLALAGAMLGAAAGCRSWMGRKPVSESVAQCRLLAGQGMTAAEVGDLDRADQLFSRALEACPTNAEAGRAYAELLWRRSNRQMAIEQLEQALKAEPNSFEMNVRAGEMYLEMGNLPAAERKAAVALEIDTKAPGAWALRGRIESAAGNPQRALADLYRALSFSPEAPDLLLDISELHRKLQRPQRALATLQHLAALYPPGEEPRQVLYLEGLAYQALGRYDDAVETLYAASVRGGASAPMLYQLANAERLAGRPRAALANVNQALSLDPTHAPSQALLARLQQHPSAAPPGRAY